MQAKIEALPFEEIWAVDTEFTGGDSGERYTVVCLVARELRSGRVIRLWENELGANPPYCIDEKALFICFVGSAELGCHLALGWPLPTNVLDLSPEFRNVVNGRRVSHGYGLVGALTRFGLRTSGQLVKDAWRDRIIQGGPWTESERRGILDYCQSDTDGLAALLPVLLPVINLPYALQRGEFIKASALMEWRGIPIDTVLFSQLQNTATWDQIRSALIPAVDASFGVYEGRVFSEKRFEAYLAQRNIPWPRLESARPKRENFPWPSKEPSADRVLA
jgi:hypothetical protein